MGGSVKRTFMVLIKLNGAVTGAIVTDEIRTDSSRDPFARSIPTAFYRKGEVVASIYSNCGLSWMVA